MSAMTNLTGFGTAATPSFAAFSPLGSMIGRGQQDPTFALMGSMISTMGALMNSLMAGATPSMAAGMPAFGGNFAAAPGLSSFLGSGSGNGAHLASRGHAKAKGSHKSGESSGSGSGAKAVQIAKKYLGRRSGQINNLKNFSHAGGATNNCADFVSACLNNAGTYKKKSGDASVATLKGHLKQQGWKKVSKGHTKAGDVAIFNGSQHVELVSAKGAKQLIGSNNNGQSYQTVTTNTPSWGSVEYYSKG